MNVVQIYDAFTINVILGLEDLGFCSKGAGGALVERGIRACHGDTGRMRNAAVQQGGTI